MADDGNLDAWEGLWCQAKAGLESNTAYFKSLLNGDSLIDHMFVIFYGGNCYDGLITS